MTNNHERLFAMAYSAEWDGYTRDWHRAFAKSHTELAALTSGANQARAEITASLKSL